MHMCALSLHGYVCVCVSVCRQARVSCCVTACVCFTARVCVLHICMRLHVSGCVTACACYSLCLHLCILCKHILLSHFFRGSRQIVYAVWVCANPLVGVNASASEPSCIESYTAGPIVLDFRVETQGLSENRFREPAMLRCMLDISPAAPHAD